MGTHQAASFAGRPHYIDHNSSLPVSHATRQRPAEAATPASAAVASASASASPSATAATMHCTAPSRHLVSLPCRSFAAQQAGSRGRRQLLLVSHPVCAIYSSEGIAGLEGRRGPRSVSSSAGRWQEVRRGLFASRVGLLGGARFAVPPLVWPTHIKPQNLGSVMPYFAATVGRPRQHDASWRGAWEASNLRPLRFAARASKKSSSSPEVLSSSPVSSEPLRVGLMVEIDRMGSGSSSRTAVGVIVRPDGKRNWIVADQHGNSFSVRPQQINFVVPPQASSESFAAADIGPFLQSVDAMSDPSLLELAWEEMMSQGQKNMTVTELAEMFFASTDGQSLFATWRLVTQDGIFFKLAKQKGRDATAAFEPRSADQVSSLRSQQQAEQRHQQRLAAFVQKAKAALLLPLEQKPTAASWQGEQEEGVGERVDALMDYALERTQGSSDYQLAEESLSALGVHRSPAAAADFLIRIGVIGRHANLEALRLGQPEEFDSKLMAAVEGLLSDPPPDADESHRVDLTHLKIFTIDSEDTVEIDDGLSIEPLADGSSRVWIHIADPSRWMAKNGADELCREAFRRGTTIYLPSQLVPMLPLPLAAGPMSLRPRQVCCAMSIAAVVRRDGSLADVSIVPSSIMPTYRLTFDDVIDMLSVAKDEEPELAALVDVAMARSRWRSSQGAVEVYVPEPSIRVHDANTLNPKISLKLIDQSELAFRLVSEMMILAGEAVAAFASSHSLPLPYRGQAPPNQPSEADLQGVPPGPCLSALLRRFMMRGEMSFSKPIPHAGLGLQGYVQFTSPIRRGGDLIAHLQVKAVLRGEAPPFSSSDIERLMANVGQRARDARKMETAETRYWLVEYLRVHAMGQGTVMRALVLRKVKSANSGNSNLAVVLIMEVAFETVVKFSRDVRIGDQVPVVVAQADARRDIIRFVEVEADDDEEEEEETGIGEEEERANEASDGDSNGGANDAEDRDEDGKF